MRESKNLEFKEMVSGTYLKTVSAFANYGDGEILFGVSDDGEAVGLEDPTGESRTQSMTVYPPVPISKLKSTRVLAW